LVTILQRAAPPLETPAPPYERTPQFEPDGWSDLEKVHKSSRRAVLGRLDKEERAAGHRPAGALSPERMAEICAALDAATEC